MPTTLTAQHADNIVRRCAIMLRSEAAKPDRHDAWTPQLIADVHALVRELAAHDPDVAALCRRYHVGLKSATHVTHDPSTTHTTEEVPDDGDQSRRPREARGEEARDARGVAGDAARA